MEVTCFPSAWVYNASVKFLVTMIALGLWLALSSHAGVQVLQFKGVVMAKPKSESGFYRVTQTNDFADGVTIQTRGESFVDLEFPGGARVRLAPDSELTIDRSQFEANPRNGVFEIDLHLRRGRISCLVGAMEAASKFEVKMAAGAVAARDGGAIFEVSSNGKISTIAGPVIVVYVLKGVVQSPMVLDRGKTAGPLSTGAAIVPKVLGAAEITSLNAGFDSLRLTLDPFKEPPKQFLKILRVTGDAMGSEFQGGFGQLLKGGELLPIPQIIKTEPGGAVDLELPQGLFLRITPESAVTISRALAKDDRLIHRFDHQVALDRGRLLLLNRTDEPKPLVAVNFPGGQAILRGVAAFDISREGAVHCLDGEVKVHYYGEGVTETRTLRRDEMAAPKKQNAASGLTDGRALQAEFEALKSALTNAVQRSPEQPQ